MPVGSRVVQSHDSTSNLVSSLQRRFERYNNVRYAQIAFFSLYIIHICALSLKGSLKHATRRHVRWDFRGAFFKCQVSITWLVILMID